MIKQIWQHKKLIILAMLVGWACVSLYNRFKPLTWCSPKQVLKRTDRAIMKIDIDTYRKLVYRSPDISDDEFEAKIQIISKAASHPSLPFLRFFWRTVFGLGQKYTKQVVQDDTAYIYSKVTVFHIPIKPFAINVLKKVDGQWKVVGTKQSLGISHWLKEIKKGDPDPDAYYYLGQLQTHSSVRFTSFYSEKEKKQVMIPLPCNILKQAYFFEKYLETTKDNFWATSASKELLRFQEFIRKQNSIKKGVKEGKSNDDFLFTYSVYLYSRRDFSNASKILNRLLDNYPKSRFRMRAEALLEEIPREERLFREYFSLYPEKKIEIEARLGYKLFEQEKNSDTIENPP
jgi:hypothetical protein